LETKSVNRYGDESAPSAPSQHIDGEAPGELTEQEIVELVARCPEPQRWAFEGWLRGRRRLDGDPVESCA
jgi:hypothetical protein